MPAGRPRKYETPEQMQEAIDAYFAEAGDRPTVTGLALELGFSDRSSLIDYAERDEFSHTIQKAKARVQVALETHLYSNSVAGVIFNLKNNFGWKDKSEQALTGPDGKALETSWTVEIVNAKSSDTS